MWWFVYRRGSLVDSVIRKSQRFKTLDDLFDDIVTQLLHPSFESVRSLRCLHCGQPISRQESVERLCPHCLSRVMGPQSSPATYPCRRCGMRFSPNLMQDGLCNRCRSTDNDEAEGQTRTERATRQTVPSEHLRRAYEILGCKEHDPDYLIKKRRRELAREFHADRLSRGASPEVIRDANQKFCAVQEAYETIMRARKETP